MRTASENIEEKPVKIAMDGVTVEGNLAVPGGAEAIVVFAHGSGSSRFSPRNRYVAQVLQRAGLATLLMDLLTRDEEAIDLRTAQYRFDIELLAGRLLGAAEWLRGNTETKNLKIGYFGSSTGAAAALIAAARYPEDIYAIVSRGGRPDLSVKYLPKVRAPTLLIVGGNDAPVIGMNEEAMAFLKAEKKLEIVPGATHLFEEPGKLEEVARLATEWFLRHLKHEAK